MRKIFRKILSGTIVLSLAAPFTAYPADQETLQKIDALTKELEALKQQVKESNSKIKENENKSKDTERKIQQVEQKSLGRWLTIGGDYRFRYDYLHGKSAPYYQFNPQAPANSPTGPTFFVPGQTEKDNSLYTNRFGLNIKAKATQDVSVTARLLMYKIAGAEDDSAINGTIGSGPFFADRSGLFDGTIGHVPGDNRLAVDRVYATWNNILGQPIWFSIGRRPSTGGIPSQLRENNEKPGNGGVPALLVDYAFDGATLGYAPDIEALPGAYAKFCYGRGFQNGITTDAGNGIHNTDMLGVQIVPYDTDLFRAEFQYNRGMNIFNTPALLTGPFQGSIPSVDLGDIDWYGIDFLGKVKNVGIGNLNWFADGALSNTHPNGKTVSMSTTNFGTIDSGSGLLFTGIPESKTGWAVYVGTRYDIEKTGTKLGFEFNHGSKDWITFTPAADDMWTSKLGTRGNVYEGYIIQELKLKPISSYVSKTFFRVGYQYYDFDYTGSNNWVGGPTSFADLTAMGAMGPSHPQMLTPLKNAQDLYATFEVHF
jgi:hypothetical protein